MKNYDSLQYIRLLGLRVANSQLDSLISFGKGELFILNFLFYASKKVTPLELCKALKSSKPRITALLKALESKGVISRDTNPYNKKFQLISLTERGENEAIRISEATDKVLCSIIEDMGKRDSLEFIRLTNKFFDSLDKYSLNDISINTIL